MSNYKESYLIAKQRFADLGIDTELAIQAMADLPVSMHCWQGDDVAGFEKSATALSGGIQATGNYPGKATNAIELRADMDKAMSLIPGPKRVNLHALYLEADTAVERNEIEPRHFDNWVDLAKKKNIALYFNHS